MISIGKDGDSRLSVVCTYVDEIARAITNMLENAEIRVVKLPMFMLPLVIDNIEPRPMAWEVGTDFY